MDVDAVDRIYNGLMVAIAGEEYESIMIALGAIHNTLALEVTRDEGKIRALYSMMADAAMCMAEIDGEHEFSPEKDSPQKKTAKKARQKNGNEPGTSGAH